jgi:hypothetical protein
VRFKGVNLTRPWAAEIVVNRRSIHLGYFADKEDAARAYDAAAHEHFGAFASPNFPREVAL